MSDSELKDFLEEKYLQYNTPDFILSDPIQIPHRFARKEDIEISAFLTASIAWGNRKMIIRNADNIVNIMGGQPYDFIMNVGDEELGKLAHFVHRTFNLIDLIFFFKSLQNIYRNHGGLETVFTKFPNNIRQALIHFRELFFSIPFPERTGKHISNVAKNSAAKRLNMFLMWMVRQDRSGVHFGIWNKIKPQYLYLPLDVHTGNVGRKLGLLTRKQNDWKSVEEITGKLRKFDTNDPVKYDFALFGLGVFEKF
ncbi:MAG: TIGR02757 family protein [Bacteroidales bacterium]|nr:TIGR02757 family protein [Bacteroidales bacterium]